MKFWNLLLKLHKKNLFKPEIILLLAQKKKEKTEFECPNFWMVYYLDDTFVLVCFGNPSYG